jgi:hypothetical protein
MRQFWKSPHKTKQVLKWRVELRNLEARAVPYCNIFSSVPLLDTTSAQLYIKRTGDINVKSEINNSQLTRCSDAVFYAIVQNKQLLHVSNTQHLQVLDKHLSWSSNFLIILKKFCRE